MNENYIKDELNGFIPTEVSSDIMIGTIRGSTLMRLCNVKEMKTDRMKIPVMTGGPGSYFVGGGKRATVSKAVWIFPEVVAYPLITIIPAPKEKLEDTTIDFFESMKPAIQEAQAATIDGTGIFGINSPFETNIYDGAVSSGNLKLRTSENLDIDVSSMMALIEERECDVDGFAARTGIKDALRTMRNKNGDPVYTAGSDGNALYQVPIGYVRKAAAWDKDKADIIAGEWKYAVLGVRAEIEYEILKEATFFDVLMDDGKPLSLAENNMIAIKTTMRLGFLVTKPDAFAVLAPAAAVLRALTVTSVAGTASGSTAITITQELGVGNSYRYKVADAPTLPKYDQKCITGWSVWDGESDITAATGKKIVIVEIDEDGEARGAGMATVTAKA